MTRRLARLPSVPHRTPRDLAAAITQAVGDLLRSDPDTQAIAAAIHALNWSAGLLAVAVATSEHTEAEYAALLRAKEEGWLAGVEVGAKTLKEQRDTPTSTAKCRRTASPSRHTVRAM